MSTSPLECPRWFELPAQFDPWSDSVCWQAGPRPRSRGSHLVAIQVSTTVTSVSRSTDAGFDCTFTGSAEATQSLVDSYLSPSLRYGHLGYPTSSVVSHTYRP